MAANQVHLHALIESKLAALRERDWQSLGELSHANVVSLAEHRERRAAHAHKNNEFFES